MYILSATPPNNSMYSDETAYVGWASSVDELEVDNCCLLHAKGENPT